jgi:hypothetical protein
MQPAGSAVIKALALEDTEAHLFAPLRHRARVGHRIAQRRQLGIAVIANDKRDALLGMGGYGG